MMSPRHAVLTTLLLTPLLLIGPWASADEKHDHGRRQQSAHVHGFAELNLALEGREVKIELDSPAANILGFEHVPSSEADQATLEKAVAVLKNGDRLFSFNEDADCRMETAKLASELIDEDQDQHAHEGEGETHSDIEAAYYFQCNAPGELVRLTVELFEAFPGLEELAVQYVIENKRGLESGGTTELEWDALIPEGWQPNKIMARYDASGLEDDDPRAQALLDEVKALWKESPVVQDLDGTRVKLPGEAGYRLEATRVDPYD